MILLITSTITPNSYANLAVKDPAIRKQQYLDALNYYLRRTEYNIVFAENSGDALDEFPVIPERIEYLSFESQPTLPDRGIGYKELQLIDFAFQNSKFLKKAKSVAKITGRLKVLNFNMLSKKFLEITTKYSNVIYVNPFEAGNMDSRCFFFTLDFWPYLKKEGQNINLRYNFELSLHDAVYQYHIIHGNNYKPQSIPLRIKGVSGSFGNDYKYNLIFHYGRYVRNLFPSKRRNKWFSKR